MQSSWTYSLSRYLWEAHEPHRSEAAGFIAGQHLVLEQMVCHLHLSDGGHLTVVRKQRARRAHPGHRPRRSGDDPQHVTCMMYRLCDFDGSVSR